MAKVTYRGVVYDTNNKKAQQAKEVELKQKHLYSKKEVFYMKNSLKEAKKQLRLHKSVKSLKENESSTNNSDT